MDNRTARMAAHVEFDGGGSAAARALPGKGQADQKGKSNDLKRSTWAAGSTCATGRWAAKQTNQRGKQSSLSKAGPTNRA